LAIVLHRDGSYARSRSNWWRRLLTPRVAARHRAGAKGEALVAAQLERLSRRYWLLHDVRLPGRAGNLDHVVVGPRGVVVVETKYYRGQVRGREGGDWHRRPYRRGWWGGWIPIPDPTLQARRSAERLAQHLAAQPDLEPIAFEGRILVYPLVVFAHPEGRVRAKTRNVGVSDTRRIRRVIKRLGHRGTLDGPDRRMVAHAVRALRRQKP
jgi:hypothetical protein